MNPSTALVPYATNPYYSSYDAKQEKNELPERPAPPVPARFEYHVHAYIIDDYKYGVRFYDIPFKNMTPIEMDVFTAVDRLARYDKELSHQTVNYSKINDIIDLDVSETKYTAICKVTYSSSDNYKKVEPAGAYLILVYSA